jgi:hypothetical protein
MDDITKTLSEGGSIELGAQRALLRQAVMTAMFCPYSNVVLDVRRAVLLDGSDHGHHMLIMTAEVYDDVVANGLWDQSNRDDYDVLDGRELFKAK